VRLTRNKQDSDADTLREFLKKLDNKGYDSEYLRTRVEYNENNQVLTQYIPHYVGCSKCPDKKGKTDAYGPFKTLDRGLFPDEHELVNKKLRHKYKQPERVYPNLLPTQASGRWSVTDPPKVTEPHPFQEDVVLPDPGTVWICWDLDAIEGKIVAAYSNDYEDLDAYDKGHDIHTITSCRMFGDPLPSNLVNPHTSPEDAQWRLERNWQGKDDKRRGLAKVRYCVFYGRDHTAAEDSAYAAEFVKQGGDRRELVEAARLFLRSKPNLVACKKEWWEICASASEARTMFGRRRRLFGDKWTRSKEGWNHMVQGAVTDMVNISIIELDEWGFSLVYPSHDAAKQVVMDRDIRGATRDKVLWRFHQAVVKDYVINGHTITTTATGYIKYPDGHKEDIII